MLTWGFRVFSNFPVTIVPLPVMGAAFNLLVDLCKTYRWVTCDFGLAQFASMRVFLTEVEDHPTPFMIHRVYFQMSEINRLDLVQQRIECMHGGQRGV